MRNIRIIQTDRYDDTSQYEHVEGSIYRDRAEETDADMRVAIGYELEEGDDSQYPLQDIMREYYVYVSEFLDGELPMSGATQIEFAGNLEEIRALIAGIVGKRVFNSYYMGEDGVEHAKLEMVDQE